MDNDTKQCLIVCASVAMVLMTFVVGCTETAKNAKDNSLKLACIQSTASWQDGNCVR